MWLCAVWCIRFAGRHTFLSCSYLLNIYFPFNLYWLNEWLYVCIKDNSSEQVNREMGRKFRLHLFGIRISVDTSFFGSYIDHLTVYCWYMKNL